MAARVHAVCGMVLLCMMLPAEVPAMRSQHDADALDDDAAAAEDDPNFLGWLQEKSSELGAMGAADLLLAKASWQARNWYSSSGRVFVKVSTMFPLHPVGSWRPATWVKTQLRKKAVLGAKALILNASCRLSAKMIEEEPELEVMRSVTPFIAVPFSFCGVEHVLFEGNGRMKGMKLAAEEDPELKDMEVEVELLQHKPDTLLWVQKGIQALWSQYVTEASELKSAANASDAEVQHKIAEYNTFRMGVVKCRGFNGGPCPVEHEGQITRRVPTWSLHGVSRAMVVPPPPGSPNSHAMKYKLCGSNEYLVDSDLKTIKEYCPLCYNHVDLARDPARE